VNPRERVPALDLPMVGGGRYFRPARGEYAGEL
jgi:hypothetical protein